jgi:regulator of protease activity HflC (stomatin/prohibitin superfamily)
MSIRQQTIEYDTIEGELAGKELINMNLKLVYSLNSDKASYVYENYGENYIDTLMPRDEVFDVVKATVAKYDIEEVRSSRDGIMTEARDALQARFGERGVTITSLALSNYNFGDLEASINAEVQAKQERKTVAEQKALELEKAQADKEIKEAQANAEKEALLIKTQADADAKKIAADGEAYQKKTLADADAYAIQKAKEEITPEYVEWQKWQKWNGSWQVIGTDGSTILSVPADTVKAAVENSNSEAQPSQGE